MISRPGLGYGLPYRIVRLPTIALSKEMSCKNYKDPVKMIASYLYVKPTDTVLQSIGAL